MHQPYDDITALIRRYNELRGPLREPIAPLWFDEHGVPRLDAHHPNLCPDIYATEVALVRISCQACAKEFEVQMSWSLSGEVMESARAWAKLVHRIGKPDLPVPEPDTMETHALSTQIRTGVIHYGDPPFHEYTGAQCSGTTMNCWDLKVMEFWKRDRGPHDWVRVAELEIELGDMTDPNRTEL